MNKNRKRLQLAIMLVVLVIAALTVAGNMSKDHKYPKVGDSAPEFALTGLDGKTYQLSDFKGKTVLLNFWATYCEPCRLEMPAIQKQAEKRAGQGVVVLGLNIGENQVTAQSFVDQIGVHFPILLDGQEEIRRNYGVKDYPTTFFIGPDGKVEVIRVGWMDEAYLESTLNGLAAPGGGSRG
jgi:peroxiredoxin